MPPTRGRISTSFAPSVCATVSALIGTAVGFNSTTPTGIAGIGPACMPAPSFLPQLTNTKLVISATVTNVEMLLGDFDLNALVEMLNCINDSIFFILPR